MNLNLSFLLVFKLFSPLFFLIQAKNQLLMSDTNRHWMGSPKRVNKLVSQNSDVVKQREFFKRQEAKVRAIKEKEMKEREARKKEEGEEKKKKEKEKEKEEKGVEEPPRKKINIGMSMNMLALCENFEPLESLEPLDLLNSKSQEQKQQ